MLAKIRSEGHIALAVASSGIASTLLPGGRTAHSMFKLPLNFGNEDQAYACNIEKNSSKAELLRQAKFIFWDEFTMSHKKCFEDLDTTLRDIRNPLFPMDCCPILLSGDFR